jgi:endonuclease/exonuclease/phosphatase family metal-dependent hydrolase
LKTFRYIALLALLVFATAAEAVPLKVITWNLHHGRDVQGTNTVDAQARWLANARPDILLLQEVEQFTGYGNFDHVAHIKAVLEAQTGRTYYAFWSNNSGVEYGKGQVNAILSVFPLTSVEGRAMPHSRALTMANVEVLPAKTVALFCVHLASSTSNDPQRATQVADLTYWLTVRGSKVRLSGGDWNLTPDGVPLAPMHYWYTDVYKKAKALGVFSGADDTRPVYKDDSVVGRIDALFLGKQWPSWMTLTVMQHADSGLSDHSAVVAEFEIH